jgi:glycosyltransferase involved in cell wall biosynthesis
MSIVFSHPTGNANVRAAAEGLVKVNLLCEFNTTMAVFQGTLVDRIGSLEQLAIIRKRRFNSSLKPFTRQWPWLEAGRIIASKAGLNRLVNHETGLFCIDAIIKNQDKRVARDLKYALKKGATAVYAYEDGARFTFENAKHLGIQCFYDLPIGYWRAAQRLLKSEWIRWPDWCPTLTGFYDSRSKLLNKDYELALADRIFVASKFTEKTLQEFPGVLAPIEVIPYGFPAIVDKHEYISLHNNRPLKLLYVGSLSQRKGIADLFASVEPFHKYVQLTVVGQKTGNSCPALDQALSNHKWISSLSHDNVIKLMQQHDVLVFPSLFEGFGLVITEAMSQGTPVITTERTAGPDFIEHGKNGWLFEAGTTRQLQAIIESLILHPIIIREAGKAAIETARNRPWKEYALELSMAVRKHLSKSN